jgi:2-dehydro-3-deoxyphosphogluconate aldolase/(4S)-4-hydroxy-2-oxoglutarate aldolase
MSQLATIESVRRARIVPVVVIDDAAKAPDLVHALAAGGIQCAEITLRTPAGLTSIAAAAAAAIPGFVVGAGTVLTPEQVDACVDAGAEFVVSPGFDDDVVGRAQERGVAVFPGIATATEIQRALRAGVESLKFFPADRLGGLATITAFASPFPTARFLPSGGVGPDNAASYLAHPSVFGISGSWMVSRAMIEAEEFARIERLSTEAMELTREVIA